MVLPHEHGDGGEPHEEGKTDGQELVARNMLAALRRFSKLERACPGNGRNAEQEGEPRRFRPFKSECAAGGHGDPGTAGSGNDRQRLCRADDQRLRQGHVFDCFDP